MIQASIVDKDSVLYLVRNLENFEKDKAIKSGLRSAVNIFRIKVEVTFGQGYCIMASRLIT